MSRLGVAALAKDRAIACGPRLDPEHPGRSECGFTQDCLINPAPIYVTLSHHERPRGEAPCRRQGHSLSRCGNDVHGGARGGRTV